MAAYVNLTKTGGQPGSLWKWLKDAGNGIWLPLLLVPFQITSHFDFFVYPFYHVSRYIIVSRCILKMDVSEKSKHII